MPAPDCFAKLITVELSETTVFRSVAHRRREHARRAGGEVRGRAPERVLRRGAVTSTSVWVETALPTLSVPGQHVAVAADGEVLRGRADDRRRAAAVRAADVVVVRCRVTRQRRRREAGGGRGRCLVQSVRTPIVKLPFELLVVPTADAATAFTVSAPPVGAVVSLRSVSVAVDELFPAASVAWRSTWGSWSCRRPRRRGSSRTGRRRGSRQSRPCASSRSMCRRRARRRGRRPGATVGGRVPDRSWPGRRAAIEQVGAAQVRAARGRGAVSARLWVGLVLSTRTLVIVAEVRVLSALSVVVTRRS